MLDEKQDAGLVEGVPDQRLSRPAKYTLTETYGPAILDSLNDIVIAIDRAGKILTFNHKAEEVFGVFAEDAQGRSIGEIFVGNPSLDQFSDVVIDSIHEDSRVERDIVIHAGDDERHLAVRSSRLIDKDGQDIIGLVIVATDITERVKADQQRLMFAYVVLSMLFTSAVSVLISLLGAAYGVINPASHWTNWPLVLLLLAPCFAIKFYFGIKMSVFGVNLRNWKRSATEGVVMSALIVLGLVGLLLLLGRLEPRYEVFQNPSLFFSLFVAYMAHASLQELAVRGFMQTALTEFFQDDRGFITIVMSSTVFAITHGHFGITAVGITFLGGLLFGWIYHRHKSLLGVCIVHIAVGFAAINLGALG